jgi:hypothetical protein
LFILSFIIVPGFLVNDLWLSLAKDRFSIRPLEGLSAGFVLGDYVVEGLTLGGSCLADLPRPDAPDDVGGEYTEFEDTASRHTVNFARTRCFSAADLPDDIQHTAQDIKGILGDDSHQGEESATPVH